MIKGSKSSTWPIQNIDKHMVTGVTQGYEKKPQLVGVGYRQKRRYVLVLT